MNTTAPYTPLAPMPRGTRPGGHCCHALARSWLALFLALTAGPMGCKKDRPKLPDQEIKTLGGVPTPLKNPAGFCFESCRRKAVCRLGEPEGKEQKKIFETSVERCGHNCVEWIKSRPYEAAAQHTCYGKPRCSALLACLSETKRLLRFSSKPEKKRECFKLCIDYGGCGGDERRCLKRCNEGDLRVYRALEGCENRGCPQVKECVDAELKKTL